MSSSSTKCPACGLTNFSSAIVCRQCGCPLIGEYGQAIRPVPPPKKPSLRWAVNATLVSIAYAIVLYCVIFLSNVIPSAMHSGETGWTDFTPRQIAAMKFWFWIFLLGGGTLIFLFFYSRRSKYETWG